MDSRPNAISTDLLSRRYTSLDELLSVSEAANLLADILDNPSHPYFCSHIIFGCRHVFMGIQPTGRDIFGINPIVHNQHRLLDSIMRFLCPQNPSRERLSEILESLNDCKCIYPSTTVSRVFHNLSLTTILAEHPGYHPTISVVEWLFSLLLVPIMLSSEVRLAKGQSTRKWPTNSSSYLPFGEDSFASSMAVWTYLLPLKININLGLLEVALKSHGRALATAVINSQSFRRAILYKLQSIVTQLKARDTRLIAISHPSEHPLSTIATLLNVLHRKSLSRQHYYMLFSEDIDQFCLVLAESARICRDPVLFPIGRSGEEGTALREETGTSLRALLHGVYRLPGRTAELSDFQAELLEADQWYKEKSSGDLGRDDRFILGDKLRAVKNSQACSVVSCESSLQSVGKSFKICGGCRIMPYCSADCQRADWRPSIENGDFPHKRVCKLIQTFTGAAGTADYMTQPSNVIKIFDWVIGEKAVDELFDWYGFYTKQREFVETTASQIPKEVFSRKDLLSKREEVLAYLQNNLNSQ